MAVACKIYTRNESSKLKAQKLELFKDRSGTRHNPSHAILNSTVFQKSDAKIQITITRAYFITIKLNPLLTALIIIFPT